MIKIWIEVEGGTVTNVTAECLPDERILYRIKDYDSKSVGEKWVSDWKEAEHNGN
jgi:hypothetical protein